MSNLIKIIDIIQLQNGANVSLIGKVNIVMDTKKLNYGEEKRICRKRDLQISDDSKHTIWLTLWNKLGEDFTHQENEIQSPLQIVDLSL